MAKSSGSHLTRVFKLIKDEGVTMIDFKFMDFPGQWQHFSVPVDKLEESSFEEGFGFDGSSIRGWKAINESDMLIIPDASTAFIDRFIEAKTLSLICDVHDPLTKEQVQALYAKFSGGVLKEKEIARVADMIWNLEGLKSMKELISILVGGPVKNGQE